MASTTAATTAPAASGQKPLTLKTYLGYAAGDAANNLAFTMASLFLILYYTNVVGVEGAVIGTMFLLVRFVDAFTDVGAGRLIDSIKPGKLGKFRPFILYFSLPLLVSSWLIYSAKWWFPDISGTAAIVYMYVTYLLMGSIFYTLVNIAYGSMAPSLTQVPTERGKLAAFRGYGSSLAVLALAFIVAPQIRGNAENPEALQRSLFFTTGAFIIAGMLLYLFLVATCKEQVVRPGTTVSFKDSMKTLGSNKPLLWLSLGAVLFLTGFTAMGTLGAYIAIYVQGNANYIAFNTLAQTIPLFIVGPLIPTVVRTVGKRIGYISFGAVGILGAAVLAFGPLATTPWTGLIAFFFLGIAVGGVNTLMWALEADTVEYGEWRTGNRTEGTTYAAFSFTRKMGQAIGGFVGGFALTWAGFSAAAASSGQSQGADVPANIQLAAGALVGTFMLLSILVMFFYPLTEQRFREMVGEIAERRAAAEESALDR